MAKVWFVTGSSRGLGREIVEAALNAGDRVVATARKPEQLKDLSEKFGDRVLALALDVADSADVAKAVAEGYKAFGRYDIVVTIDLMVPKDRDGEFQTELFERCQRSEKALVLAMLEMYVGGVSTRKASAITEALCGLEVSRIGSREPGLGADREAGCRPRGVAEASADAGVSVPGGGRAL